MKLEFNCILYSTNLNLPVLSPQIFLIALIKDFVILKGLILCND